MYKFLTTPNFRDDFNKLSEDTAERIKKKLKYLARNSNLAVRLRYTPDFLKRLCKYRVGSWRVLLWVNDEKKSIVLYAVKHRKEIYDRLD